MIRESPDNAFMNSLVIIPVYSEEQTIKEFFKRLRAVYKDDLALIDDGSEDNSLSIIKGIKDSKTFILRHAKRKGYGATLLQGFSFALKNAYRKAVTIDCDLQHDPEDIPLFLAALDEYEAVSGSRYIKISRAELGRIPPERRKINQYITSLINYLFDFNLTDSFCGLRGYRDSFLKKAQLAESGYGLALEIILEIIRLEAAFKEIPVAAHYLNTSRIFQDNLSNPRKRLQYYLGLINQLRNRSNAGLEQIPNPHWNGAV